MILILSDIPLNLSLSREAQAEFIDLSALKISTCTGCFGCWTKTPGRCVIRDDAVKVYPLIAAADKVVYISRIMYGSYDSVMKTMLERAIPIQQAFIRLAEGETHHVQRAVAAKDAVVIGWGAADDDEKNILRTLVSRNARNMNFERYKVVFAEKENLRQTVHKEIDQWIK